MSLKRRLLYRMDEGRGKKKRKEELPVTRLFPPYGQKHPRYKVSFLWVSGAAK